MTNLKKQMQPTDLDALMRDKGAFKDYIYTPWEEAMDELTRRDNDLVLAAYVNSLLPDGVPALMRDQKCMVLFRHIATSNYETRRFFNVADSLSHLRPAVFEYHADKFNDRNEWKRYAGKLHFSTGTNKHRELLFETKGIIHFNDSNNVPLNELKTFWGESFIDFHHRLFLAACPDKGGNFEDLTSWLRAFGPTARDYYLQFLSLFLRNGVLFDNFLVDTKEASFTREIILPSLERLRMESGYKPLIISLDPSSMEGHQFWLSHPLSDKALIEASEGGAPKVGNEAGILT